MPSEALQWWRDDGSAMLDRVEATHGQVGGPGRGRRFTLDHINQAYAVALGSHFQRFCRDLHSESIDVLANWAPNPQLEGLFRELARQRYLDRGNANPGNIGNDFNRFGLQFWQDVRAAAPTRTPLRQQRLEDLNTWRNAIAHQDFGNLQGQYLTLQQVRIWRGTCDGLAATFDGVMARHLRAIVGAIPW